MIRTPGALFTFLITFIVWDCELAAFSQPYPFSSCHLEQKLVASYEATLKYRVSTPNCEAVGWIVFSPCPPSLAGQQRLIAAKMECEHTNAETHTTRELSPERRPVLVALVPVDSSHLRTKLS